MSNIILPNNYSEIMWNSYGCNNNAAGFIMDQTDLFVNQVTGETLIPYPKQIHFLNLLNPEDRIIVVLKIRQCISGDSLIQLTPNTQISIKELLQSNYRGQCLTYDCDMNLVNDQIIDIWSTGIQQVYEICFNTGERIETTNKELFNTPSGFKKLCDLNVDDICIRFTEENSSSQILTTITSIKQNGFKETYDLTTKKHHSYIANGLHLHNSGFSTAIVGRVSFESYFGQYPEIVIVSASRGLAEKNLDRVKNALRSMPEEFRPVFKRDNMSMLELQNGIKVYSLASNPQSTRGRSGSVYIDEMGIIPSKDSYEIWTSLFPSTSTGGRIVCVSTPKGKTGKFFDLATKTLAEINGGNVQFESVKYKVALEDVPHILYAKEHRGLFDGLTISEIEQEYGLLFTSTDDESFFTEDFLMQNLIERDSEDLSMDNIIQQKSIPLYRCYEDFGIPNDYEYESETPLDPKFYIKNNPNFKHLIDEYSSFIGGFDPASTNDDSMLVIQGVRRSDSKKRDVILEMDMKIFSQDIIIQAKHAIRIIRCFDLSSLAGDYTSIGRGLFDYLKGFEDIEEILELVTYNTGIKVDGFVKLKTTITSGNLKRRFDGLKSDKSAIKQMTNIYYENGKMVGKNGKDDLPNAYMLCELASRQNNDSGVFFV